MNHLHSAIRKCSYQYGRNWGGYLQPKETLALRDFGVRIDSHYVDAAIYQKRKGIGGGRWTYFDLPKGKIEDEFKQLKEGLKCH